MSFCSQMRHPVLGVFTFQTCTILTTFIHNLWIYLVDDCFVRFRCIYLNKNMSSLKNIVRHLYKDKIESSELLKSAYITWTITSGVPLDKPEELTRTSCSDTSAVYSNKTWRFLLRGGTLSVIFAYYCWHMQRSDWTAILDSGSGFLRMWRFFWRFLLDANQSDKHSHSTKTNYLKKDLLRVQLSFIYIARVRKNSHLKLIHNVS